MKKGTIDAMGFTVIAVSIFIGIYLIGSVYNSVEGDTSLPASVTQSIEDTLDNGGTGMSLMGVGLIVMAAMGILTIMGSK
jgi:hypothetical protein